MPEKVTKLQHKSLGKKTHTPNCSSCGPRPEDEPSDDPDAAHPAELFSGASSCSCPGGAGQTVEPVEEDEAYELQLCLAMSAQESILGELQESRKREMGALQMLQRVAAERDELRGMLRQNHTAHFRQVLRELKTLRKSNERLMAQVSTLQISLAQERKSFDELREAISTTCCTHCVRQVEGGGKGKGQERHAQR